MMKNFVSFIIAMFFLVGFSERVSAETPGGQPPKKEMTVEQLKTNIITDIDARIKILQADRGCVSAARTKEDLKKCVQLAGEERKQLKAKRDVRREQRNKDK
ncbi:MAG: hypothetical protein WA610_07725 [Thermodesulfovibrionales bacterium]